MVAPTRLKCGPSKASGQHDRTYQRLKNTTSLRKSPVWLPGLSRGGSIKIAHSKSGIYLSRVVFGRRRALRVTNGGTL